MKIQISKDDFEQSILAATSSHSEVFESVEKHFEESYQRLSRQILGEVGEEALETSDDLREAVIKAVCLDAFLGVVRHLDLVLTPTGFGVVANMIRQRLSMRRTLPSNSLPSLTPLTRHMMSSICSSDTSLRRVASASCMAASFDIQSLEVMLVCLVR